MSRFLRLTLYALLCALLFGGTLGFPPYLMAFMGAGIALLHSERRLGWRVLLVITTVFAVLVVIGIGRFSIDWFIAGAIVAVVLFILEAFKAFDRVTARHT